MNPHTVQVLEFPKILELLAENCTTTLGRNYARTLMPITDRVSINRWLEEIDEVIRSGLTIEFFQPFEPDYLRNKLCLPETYLPPEDFNLLRTFLLHIGIVRSQLRNRLLKELTSGLGDYSLLIRSIDQIFLEDGSMRSDASPRLRQISKSIAESRQKIQEILQNISRENERFLSDTTITIREGRYVLPLKAAHRGMIRGIVNGRSASEQTIFIEPLESIEEQNRLAELISEEEMEIVRILKDLSDKVRASIDAIESDIIRIGRLDLIFAKARFAQKIKGNRVRIDEEGRLKIKRAIHPLLLISKKIDEIVPLDLSIDHDTSIIVISGPNAGGKTVALKTIGLLALMNQAGLFVPAEEGTSLKVFSKIFVDIGDEQSIEDAQSTFSGHLRIVNEALQSADGDTLLLFDEFLSQTSPDEGAALACSMLEEFKRRGALLFATTHNEKIKMFVQTQPGMKNAGMEFKDRPTYRLIVDVPQGSNALLVAQEMGIEAGILKRAREFLDPQIYSFNQLLENLAQEATQVKKLREELEELKKDYEARIGRFGEYTKQQKAKMHQEFESLIDQQRREFSTLIRRIKESRASKPAIEEARKFMAQAERTLEKRREPYFPRMGETVSVPRYKFKGEVLAIEDQRYLIGSEKMKIWVGPDEIEMVKEEKNKVTESAGISDFIPVLNLRGKFRDDIFPALDRFIYDAICKNYKVVTILHGKGRGILRQAVADYLKKIKEVKSFRSGELSEGGTGVTIVELE